MKIAQEYLDYALKVLENVRPGDFILLAAPGDVDYGPDDRNEEEFEDGGGI